MLAAIVDDDAAPEELRTLARVLADLQHTPSPADKEKLQEIAGD